MAAPRTPLTTERVLQAAVELADREGVGSLSMRRLARELPAAEAKANIDRVEYLERDANVAVLRFGIEVTDRAHLADVIRKVRKLTVALGVQRI